MNYLLIFYTGNSIKEVTLKKGECITVGTGENDTLRLQDNNLSVSHLILRHVDNGINILSHAPFDIMGNQSVNMILSAGDTVNITERVMLAIFESNCNCDSIISLNRLNEVSIGRSSRNDICLKGSLVSSHHAVLRKNKDKWVIKDRQSHNGIFVDGTLIASEKAELNNEAIIFIGGFIIEFRNNTLRFKNTPGDVILSPIIIDETVPIQLTNRKPYPFFYRSPRIRMSANKKDVEVLAPPSTGTRPSVSWLSVLLPPSMMIIVMLSVAAFTKNVSTLFYTLPMSSVSVIVAVINYNGQKKKWLQMQELASKKYQEHLTEKEKEITEYETTYISTLSSINPGILECIAIAKTLDRRLWERTPTDSDFLNIRLGTGQVTSNVDIKIPKEQLTLEENPFLKEAANLKDRHKILSGIPVCHSFLDSPITGLEGTRESVKKIAWSIIINIATHHSYEDVKIVCVYPENEKNQWEWIRWLPHVWNDERTKRFMSCTLETKNKNQQEAQKQDNTARTMLRELSEILKFRQRESSNDRRNDTPETPFYFLVCADKTLVESCGEQFLPESSMLGFAVLYAYGDIRTLPKECNAIIDCGNWEKDLRSSIQMTFENEAGKIFTPDGINLNLNIVDRFARSLAPVHLQSSAGSGIPSKVSFLQGFGVKRVEELNLMQGWESRKTYESLAAPIGIRENGDIFNFDIHEKSMGVHGVVAGTSGSGKSEMLTAWLLSMATYFSPKDVNFLLIEFKGNDLSNILKTLPHIAGIVNNLQDASLIERSLRSLDGEKNRRMEIFSGIDDLAEKNISAYQMYQKKHPERTDLEPLPFLITVLDEFAEFKSQFPDQMDLFNSITRVGRSVGIFMIPATQSPGGIITPQMEANFKFRICLRTANTGESKEIIGTTDAFFIANPGRAYVKVGDSIYEQVQTLYSKVPYNPNEEKNTAITDIEIVEINGRRVKPNVKYDKTVRASNDVLTEGQAVVQSIVETAKKHNFPKVRPVWTEPLPPKPDKDNPKKLNYLFLSELSFNKAFRAGEWMACNTGLFVIVGLVDNPEAQRQYPFVLNFTNDGHQVLYGAPSSGKTTFLQTAILSTALSYTPEQAQFLVLDFGNWGMKIFEGLPHMLMVGDSGDKEKIKKAEEYLLATMDSRKRLFAAQGVGTLEAYREVSGKVIPSLIVVVDNMAALYSQYPDTLDTLIQIAREGGSLGIYLLLTAGNPGSFMFRIAQYVKSNHALQLTDRSDYRALVGGTGRQEPAHYPGRGFTKGPLEFQTALCVDGVSEGERVKQLKSICTAMSDAWKGARASMEPEEQEVNADTLIFDHDSVQIGINSKTAETVSFNFRDMNGCIISGTPGSGKSNILALIVRALSYDEGTKIYIYEKETNLEAICKNQNWESAHDGSTADTIISKLADEYDRRSEEEGDYTNKRIVLCIDDFPKFFDEIAEESLTGLDVIIRNGADYEMYVYIAGDRDGMTRLHNFLVKPVESCLANGNAIALGIHLREHAMFTALHRDEDVTLSRHEGCLIHNKTVSLIKIAGVLSATGANIE